MIHHIRIFAPALLLVCVTYVRAEDKSKSYEEARARAMAVSDITGAGPVNVMATVTLYPHGQHGTAMQGIYSLNYESKDNLREEMRFPQFESVVVVRSGEQFVERTLAPEPLLISYVRGLAAYGRNLPKQAPITSTEETNSAEGEQRCFRFQGTRFIEFGPPMQFRACFDQKKSTLTTAGVSFPNGESEESRYSDFREDGGKVYPMLMQQFERGELVVQIKVGRIDHTSPAAQEFEPPKGAENLGQCARFEGATPVVDRHMFKTQSKRGGNIVVAGVLDEHGRIQETQIQRTIDPETDRLALQATKWLDMEPAKCDGRAVRSLFRLSLWFRAYGDNRMDNPVPTIFESFR